MIYRVYLRLPAGTVSDKTTTNSLAVARFAFCELITTHAGKNVAASMTSRETGAGRATNLQYVQLNKLDIKQCALCNNYSPFLDNSNLCPDCKPTKTH